MQAQPIIAVQKSLFDECVVEAKRTFPLETGGAFMGAQVPDGSFLITHWIPPGPNADHRRYSFQPNAEWQWAEMERLYNLHHGQLAYLGDWHSHPKARHGQLSRTDRRAVREILSGSTPQMAWVISAIIYGGEPVFEADFWVAEFIPRQILWPKLRVLPGELTMLA